MPPPCRTVKRPPDRSVEALPARVISPRGDVPCPVSGRSNDSGGEQLGGGDEEHHGQLQEEEQALFQHGFSIALGSPVPEPPEPAAALPRWINMDAAR